MFKKIVISNFNNTAAIISNTNTSYSPDGFGKSYYLEHVRDKYYAIKTFDPEKNSFNLYLTYTENGLEKSEHLSKNNPSQLWEINISRDNLDPNDLPLVSIRSKLSNEYFNQNYDNMGISSESTSLSNINLFKFQSFNGSNPTIQVS